jgi:hypothetical protein
LPGPIVFAMRLSIAVVTSAYPVLSPACCVVDAAAQPTGSCGSAGSSVWEDYAADEFDGFARTRCSDANTSFSLMSSPGRTIQAGSAPSDCARGLGRMAGRSLADADSSRSGGQRPAKSLLRRRPGRVFDHPTSQSSHRHLPSFKDRLGRIDPTRTKRYALNPWPSGRIDCLGV